MNKLKKKKGFTLIEMLVVIAIIAALVSIIFPTVEKSTLQSRAATNAANLREVEAALSTLRVANYDEFMNASLQIEANLGSTISGTALELLNRLDGLGTALQNALRTMEASDGVLTLDLATSGTIQITAPAAKEVKVNGENATLYCAKGTQMQIFITENQVVCLYGGYAKEDFADVAEDGVYDAAGKEVTGGQEIVDKITCATSGHNWGADGGSTVCLRAGCGATRCSFDRCTNAASSDGLCLTHAASGWMCENLGHDWKSDGEDSRTHHCGRDGCTATGTCNRNGAKGSCTECGGCVTPDTLITLANGSQKRVDELTGNETLLVWNHNTGSLDAAPVAYVIDHDKAVRETEIMKLVFSDGNYVKIIGEHVFFDATVGKYVAITSSNADSFIGHSFPAMSDGSDSLHMTKLVTVERTVEETEVYEVVTNNTLTCFTNNVLSGCAYMDGLLNIFDIDVETMAYDKSAMEADLAKYGTIDYAFFAPFVSREMFDMYNGQYMSVAMGKGVLSLGDIMDLIDMHYQYVG